MNELTLKPSIKIRLWFAGIVLAMASFPIFWVFTLGDGSLVALIIALLLPFVVDQYTATRNVIHLKGGCLQIKNFVFRKKQIDTLLIGGIKSYRSTSRVTLEIKLITGEHHTIPVYAFELEEIINLIQLLVKANPRISIPEEFRIILAAHGSEKEFKTTIKNFETRESYIALGTIVAGLAMGYGLWLYKTMNGEKSARELVDMFVAFLN